jgi:hypothetical protein
MRIERISGFQDFRILGFQDLRISGSEDVPTVAEKSS